MEKILYVDKECFLRYKGQEKSTSKFFQVFLNDFTFMSKVSALFKQGFKLNDDNYYSDPFESNVNFSERFLIEKDISGMSWIQCPQEKYKLTNYRLLDQINQIEIESEDLVSLKSFEEMAPLRVLSFDIECHSFGKFPDAQKHSVNTMGFVCQIHGESEV